MDRPGQPRASAVVDFHAHGVGDPSTANLLIVDISRARERIFTEVARGNWNALYPGAGTPANDDFDLALHDRG